MKNIILEMRKITKIFPGVKALDNVDLTIFENEIHALVGENGAGKSTLMNILSGVYPYGNYDGSILFSGEECTFKDIKESEACGIAIIHQELALIPFLSVAENVFLGNERQKRGIVGWNETYKQARELLKKVGYKGSFTENVIDISVGQQQLVEIAKALSKKVRLLILDEPTSALNEAESNHLLNLLLELKKEGLTSIIISHKINEVERVADKITIIRDGAVIETLDKEKDIVTEERIIRGMVGREILDIYPARQSNIGETMFEVCDWYCYDSHNPERKVLDNINLHVKKGEVIGISGLMGAGRTEFALSVFGCMFGTKISGTVLKGGVQINTKTVAQAIENGISYTTEDRKAAGLVLGENILDNIVLAHLYTLSKNGIRSNMREIRAAEKQVDVLNIKCSSIYQKALNLSGGNQQKVVLAKWMLTAPDVLILDEPTRGIDVGAKREIYNIINSLADEGKSVIFISSEMAELLGMCDRLYIMNQGRIVGELDRSAFSQEAVMEVIMKSNREEAYE